MMKKVYVSILKDGTQAPPEEESLMVPLYLTEIPAVGDTMFFTEPEDCDDEDWFTDLMAYCDEFIPRGRTPGYHFKVVERTLIRSLKDSWFILYLAHVPGIRKKTNTNKSEQ